MGSCGIYNAGLTRAEVDTDDERYCGQESRTELQTPCYPTDLEEDEVGNCAEENTERRLSLTGIRTK